MATGVSVEELSGGDHACLTFSDGEERLDIVATFVGKGLAGDQMVVCFTDQHGPRDLLTEFADRGIDLDVPVRKGQLVLSTSDESWLAGGAFQAGRMIDTLARHLDEAHAGGYAGLRVTADMNWATRPAAGLEQLADFESAVNELFVGGQLTAICQYDRENFDPVTLAIAARAHPRAVAATIYHEDLLLRICRQHSPPGIRIAGELDFTRLEPLAVALGEAIRLDVHPQINLRGLHFIDAAAAGAILQTALAMPEPRTLTVTCSGLVAKALRLVGATDCPTLRLVTVHVRP